MPPEVTQPLILQRDTKSSIEVSRNYKGEYAFTTKAYFEEGHETEALDTLKRIDQQLRATYLPEPTA